MSKFRSVIAGALIGALLAFQANAQQSVLQGGPWVNGHVPVYGGASSSYPVVIDSGSAPAVINAGTAGQVPYYATSGSTLTGNANLTISAGAVTFGVAGSTLGSLNLSGSTSGAVSIIPQPVAGGFNFNLPISAGAAGHPLLSGGGGSSPMSWGNLSGTTSTFATTTGVLTSGHCAVFDGSGNLADNGSGCGGSGTVNSGSAGQFSYYASTGTAVSGSSVLTVSGSTLTTSGNVVGGGSISAASQFVAGANAGTTGSIAFNGNVSGQVIVKPQAAAGSYNFNLPITAGTSGQPLISGGGGAGAMGWGGLSGNTTTFGTTSGSLTNGHLAAFDASGNIVDGGVIPTGSINSGTGGRFAWYAANGTTISDNANLTISSGAVTVGVGGATAGSVILSGSSTGAITIKGTGTTIGTYNFNLPTTVGTAGQPMLSGGGGASAMSWGTLQGNTTKFVTASGSFTVGNCVSADASGNLVDNGTPCGSGGSGTVTSSTANQVAYFPLSSNVVAGNSSLTISGGDVTVGVPTTTLGTISVSGNTSGKVTIKPQAAAGTYNFNLPTTAGSAGQVLISQGGGTSAMTWGSAGLAAVAVQTANFNAASGSSYCVDTTGGAVTATLPASPANSDEIEFLPCSLFSTNNLILGRNSNNIQLLAQNLTINNNNVGLRIKFVTSYGWILE